MAAKVKPALSVSRFSYNPERDLKPVEQTGFVDLAKANSMNALPANLVVDTLSFNEIDNPNSIGYRPKDQFEHAQGSRAIADYKPPQEGE